jgi:hypothetical protein
MKTMHLGNLNEFKVKVRANLNHLASFYVLNSNKDKNNQQFESCISILL